MSAHADQPSRAPVFAARLNHLFATVHPGGRPEYTNTEVAQEISQRGESISDAYIGMLRSGKRDNPTYSHLKGLADFFGVSVDYFFNDDIAKRIDADLELVAALRDNDVLKIALRSRELTAKSRRAVLNIIEQVRQIEGLDDGGDLGSQGTG